MGKHLWDEAIMKECDGDWMFTRHCDFRNLLIQVARANGADVRFGTRVVEIDEDDAVILLEDGEVFNADVIIGSDGPQGITRKVVKDNMDHVQESGKVVYKSVYQKLQATRTHMMQHDHPD
jgi:salicylate hydroxylase